MHKEESAERGPARSLSAIVTAAVGSTALFWLIGDALPGSIDLQVGVLVVSFGLILAITVGYSWTVDKVWKRASREATDSLASFKGDFVARISHELRTSLTGIVGFAQLVDPEVIGGDNAEAINTVIAQSVELSRVVDDLTATARLDSDSVDFEPEETSIRDEVEKTVRLVNLMGLDVSVECRDANVLVDAEGIRHVVGNLLVNAHRHGLAPVSVRGHAFGQRYICQVVDQGAGLSDEYEKLIAENFGSRRPRGGDGGALGLGLTVAHRMAERLGCELTHRRVRGETHFILTIPLAPRKAEPKPALKVSVPKITRTPKSEEEHQRANV